MTRTKRSHFEVVALLKDWGFEEVGYKDNCPILSYEGRRVMTSDNNNKVLRKAAKILRLPLKDLLKGKPRAEIETKETVMVQTKATYACDQCDKTFESKRAFAGHRTSHNMVRCNLCGKSVSQSGLGSHQRGCRPKKRGPGRPRKPIAEAIERPKTKAHETGVEVPVLDDLDLDFPSADDFAVAFKGQPQVAEDSQVDSPVTFDEAEGNFEETVLTLFFPGRTLPLEQQEAFLNWVYSTRSFFNELRD